MNKKALSFILILCLFVSGTFMFSACKNKATALESKMIILAENEFTYTGESITPEITVKIDETIIDSSNYTISYSNNVNVGDAIITVSAKKESSLISGSASISFKIISSLENVSVSSYESLKSAIINNKIITLNSTITIPASETLIIPDGTIVDCGDNKIIVSGKIIKNGTIRANADSKSSLLDSLTFANEITITENINETIEITSERDVVATINLNGKLLGSSLEISNFAEPAFTNKIELNFENWSTEEATIGDASQEYGIVIKGNEDVNINFNNIKILGETGVCYESIFNSSKISFTSCSISSTTCAVLIKGSAIVTSINSTFTSAETYAYKAEKGKHYITSCTFSSADSESALDLTAISDENKIVS